MSYDIWLNDPVTGEQLHSESKHDLHGGTYALGGTTQLWINITYNYAPYFYEHIDEEEGIRSLYGKVAATTIPILQEVIGKLGDDVDDNYWEPTEGNAKRALTQLLALAYLRPDGVWDGD